MENNDLNEIGILLINAITREYNEDVMMPNGIRNAYIRSIRILQEQIDFTDMTKEELERFGFREYTSESKLMLMPLYVLEIMDDRTILTNPIGERREKKDLKHISNDFDMLFWGIKLK